MLQSLLDDRSMARRKLEDDEIYDDTDDETGGRYVEELLKAPHDEATESRDRRIKRFLRRTKHLELALFDTLQSHEQVRGSTSPAQLFEEMRKCATSAISLTREQQILQTFRFDTMEAREANISQAHSATFDWILQPESMVEHSHIDVQFTNWLRHSDGIYWIAGKPGSGKSTLMKYIYNDTRTRTYLDFWAAGTL